MKYHYPGICFAYSIKWEEGIFTNGYWGEGGDFGHHFLLGLMNIPEVLEMEQLGIEQTGGAPKSSYRRSGLAPRCRLVTSWGWRRSQGLGCSPIKVARELGSERRETVRSLSVVGVRNLRGSDTSTRGPCWTDRWFTCCSARGIAG